MEAASELRVPGLLQVIICWDHLDDFIQSRLFQNQICAPELIEVLTGLCSPPGDGGPGGCLWHAHCVRSKRIGGAVGGCCGKGEQ